jgi:hypothetical protein
MSQGFSALCVFTAGRNVGFLGTAGEAGDMSVAVQRERSDNWNR